MPGSPPNDLHALLRLTLTSGLGPILIARLLEHLGSPQTVCRASVQDLVQIPGIGQRRAGQLVREIRDADVQSELELVERHGVTLIPISDPSYPALLRMIPDPPPLLYLRGKLDPKADLYNVAIVGSRRCTLYGREQAVRISSALVQAGFAISSGGASGIDTAAHRGALRIGGRTIVVQGCGLSSIYPRENFDLFEEIVASGGAMLSEFPMQTPPVGENFPRRNRIISGLALGTLVVEASDRSGALITARVACEDHGREVMALPGRVDSDASTGCHRLIRDGGATLITSAPDVIDCLEESRHLIAAATSADPPGLRPGRPEPGPEERASKGADGAAAKLSQQNLSPSQRKILDQIGPEPIELGELAARTNLEISRLQADLTMLQIRGLVGRTTSSGVHRHRP